MMYEEEVIKAIHIGFVVANFLLNIGHTLKAIELYKESLNLFINKALSIEKRLGRLVYHDIYRIMCKTYHRLSDHTNAVAYGRKLLAIQRECSDTVQESLLSIELARLYYSQSMYTEAKEVLEGAIHVIRTTGEGRDEAIAYEVLAMCYVSLGAVFLSLGEYVKAREYQEKALVINMDIGNKAIESACYGILGAVFLPLGEYVKAREFSEKALVITKDIGNKAGEAACYGNLGTLFQFLGENFKAIEYHEKALVISMEIGDKEIEEACYGNLGTVFRLVCEYVKAREYFEKALVINMKTGNKAREAAYCTNLGVVFRSLGEYVKAREYQEKALAINMEIGNKAGEAACYANLGCIFAALGEYRQAGEYHAKALKIEKKTGGLKGQVKAYLGLATVFQVLQQNEKSKSYSDEAFAISMRSGDKEAEALCYLQKGDFFEILGDKEKAKACFEKALAIALQMCDRSLEVSSYFSLGRVFQSLGNHDVAEEYFEKVLSTSKEIGNPEIEYVCYCHLTLTKLSQNNLKGASSVLLRGIEKCEKMRGFLQDSDEMKISFADTHFFPYQSLSSLLLNAGNPKDALNVADLGRARALGDLMATQYSAEKSISADPQLWTGVENVMKNESDCTCLYISYFGLMVFLWILKPSGAIQFRKIELDKKTLYTRLTKVARNLDEFFAIMAESFGSFGILPAEVCEDRSIIDNNNETNPESCQEGSPATLRQGKTGDMNDPQPSLTLFYELLVNPVSELLDDPEIIIVPDRSLYRVPFPALLNKRGKYLSENFRIRIVPSLSTLKLIQDSPVDYHSQTGALIVGDPDVGTEVIYRGSVKRDFIPLPGARKEAEMIARRLGVWPLLGEHATKPAVLERMKSASLIHIAAHGNAERGEIALAPPASSTGIPQEGDYLLKMSDIAKVQVRAKLVVLSCCHSGRGQIRAEGVVGIARAFLGSGARSVLVSLWALDDNATKKLMSRFYEHLVRGESASVSLHAAMKWMRDHGFIKVPSWAPFMLIGDDVTFAFEK